MTPSQTDPILTLEPFVEAVRAGVVRAGWAVSGLQKTTSHQFEGRWEGESTRSAYLFFHKPDGPAHVSVDVYLDETSRGITGNLALVVDLVTLGALGGPREALETLASASAARLPDSVRRPVTLRFRLHDAAAEVNDAETEVRFKVRIPRKLPQRGFDAVADFVEVTTVDFGSLLDAEVVRALGAEE